MAEQCSTVGGLGSIGRTKMSTVRTEELDPQEREICGSSFISQGHGEVKLQPRRKVCLHQRSHLWAATNISTPGRDFSM